MSYSRTGSAAGGASADAADSKQAQPLGTGQLKLHRNLSVWEAIGISLA